MSEYFLGQIMLTGFGFAPKFFAQCNNQLLPIAQNSALFSLLGVQFGGDGIRTFALPDLRGRTLYGAGASSDPAWQPSALPEGALAGTESVSVTLSQLPLHIHAVNVINNQAGGNRATAPTSVYGQANGVNVYGPPSAGPVTLDPGFLSMAGGSQPHPNVQPFQTINMNIALSGIFPSRN